MADQQSQDYGGQQSDNEGMKIRDLEERQRTLRDKVRLIGENLIDLREKTQEDITNIKEELEKIKTNLNRTLSFMESASEQLSKFARKEDLEILSKQAKMFQPLNLQQSNVSQGNPQQGQQSFQQK